MTNRGFARGRLASAVVVSCFVAVSFGTGAVRAASSDFDGFTWNTDRAEPQLWEVLSSFQGMDNVLHIKTFPSTTVPGSSGFYQTEGRAALTNLPVGPSDVSGQFYLSESAATSDGVNYTSMAMWGVLGVPPGTDQSYPVIGFYNGPSTDPAGEPTVQGGSPVSNVGEIRVYDSGQWVVVTGPNAAVNTGGSLNYGGWNTIRMNYVPGADPASGKIQIIVNGTVVHTLGCGTTGSNTCGDFTGGPIDPALASLYSIILNTRANGSSSEDVYWANIYAALLVPEGQTRVFGDGAVVPYNVDIDKDGMLSGGYNSPFVITGNVNNFGGIAAGNFVVTGNFFNQGAISPGNSPGIVSIGGNYTADANAAFLMQADIGAINPVAGTDYDQVKIGGNAGGKTAVLLYEPGSSDPLAETGPVGDIEKIKLVTIGGTVGGDNFVLGRRYVRNGMDIVLNPIADPSGGTDITLGLKVADESYDLASISSSALYAGDLLMGTYVDRRGLNWDSKRNAWMHAVADSTTLANGLGMVDLNISGAQFGLDMLKLGDPSTWLGATFGYSATSGKFHSPSGTVSGTWDGTAPSVGAYVTHQGEFFYADLLGQYRFLDYNIAAPMTAKMNVGGGAIDVSAEAGLKVPVGDRITLIPFAQVTYEHADLNRSSTGPFNATFPDADAVIARTRLLAQIALGPMRVFGSAGVSDDVGGGQKTNVSGTNFLTNLGGATAEFTAGVDGTVGGGLSIFGSGQYNISFDGNTESYMGRGGIRKAF